MEIIHKLTVSSGGGKRLSPKRLDISLIIISLFFIFGIADAQNRIPTGGTITGTVVDSVLKTPIEYATVILLKDNDSTPVTGISTDAKGIFRLGGITLGKYKLQVSFLGYHNRTLEGIVVSPENRILDLGEIPLNQTSLSIDGIRVEAEKPAFEYRIDKKVINVSKQYTSISGSAVDVLENVPSVTVDIEGNVQLRGSSSFTVLIDGRPSILDANDALQQIPASTIDNIEIITNPSARYDPDGTSGIINIVLKKNQLHGLSGIINSNGGPDSRYGGDISLNFRNSSYATLLSINYGRRSFDGSSREENRTTQDDVISYLNSSGDTHRGGKRYGVRGGIDFNLSPADLVSVGFRLGGRAMKGDRRLNYDEWSEPENLHLLYSSGSNEDQSGFFYAANFDYRHKFARKNHELSGQVNISRRDMDEESKYVLLDSDDLISSAQITTEEGPANRIRLKLDYTLPLNDKNKVEMGYQSRLGDAEDTYRLEEYNLLSGEYELLPEYSRTTEYVRNIHSLYAMYGGESGNYGYQIGIRGEYTYRNIDVVGESQEFNIDRWDIFPTLHFSRRFDGGHQLMSSYTRRIKRPRGWWLEPFESRTDAYNIRIGNPDLKPEYIDSYEIGYQKTFGKSLISAEAYYRITHNKVEFIQTVYDENITLRSVENVGTDYTFGTELMWNITLFKFWELNYMGNLYNYRVEGILYDENFSEDEFSWDARMNNTIKFGKKTRMQLNGRYNSRSITSQGSRKGFFTSNLALKHDFVPRVLSATLQVNDIFGTSKRESTTEGNGFYNYSYSTREAPVIMLNISYIFNNFKSERQQDSDQENLSEDDF